MTSGTNVQGVRGGVTRGSGNPRVEKRNRPRYVVKAEVSEGRGFDKLESNQREPTIMRDCWEREVMRWM